MLNETESFLRNFDAPPLVVTLQDSPRFGHSTDITALMGSNDEAADYTAGLIAATFVTIICFFVAFSSLPILMFLGQKRVGFLSGAPLKARSERSSSLTSPVDENFNDVITSDIPEKPEASTLVDEMQGQEEQNSNNLNEAKVSVVDKRQRDEEESTPFEETEGHEEQYSNLASVERSGTDGSWKQEGSTSFVDKTQGREEQTNEPYSIDALQKPDETIGSKTKRRNCCLDPSHMWVRGTFIISGVVFILFSILLGTQGVLNLQTTIDSVNNLATQIDDLALDADNLLQSTVLRLQTQASSIRDLLVSEFSDENFCPADPTFQNNAVFALIREQAGNASVSLSQLNDFIANEALSISDAINDAAKGARQVKNNTDDVNIGGWKLAIILIPYTIVPFMLVLAAILAYFDRDIPRLNCANRWFFMPFFLILVIIAAGTACGMIAAASANSDFCLPGGQPNDNYPGTSPDTTMWRVLDRKNHKTDLERKIADFYIDQCQNKPDPFVSLRNYVPKVMDSRAQLDEFLQSLQSNDTLTELSGYCNRTYDNFDELINEMTGLLDVILDATRGTLNLISCSRIVPIYHSAFYDSSCAYSVSAVFWVFSSSLIMGSFGLIMLLFRSACKPTLREGALMDVDNNEHVLYDEELKDPGEKETDEYILVNHSEVEDAIDELSPVSNTEEQEVKEADGHVTADMGDISNKL